MGTIIISIGMLLNQNLLKIIKVDEDYEFKSNMYQTILR